ncbi:hypothetical protein JCM33374_g4415 [Metschnikowia sp. JCM 33374]|nr:hypothetical protein JCM33374_g4415 [Metschnikowia sp. JCM 33374]
MSALLNQPQHEDSPENDGKKPSPENGTQEQITSTPKVSEASQIISEPVSKEETSNSTDTSSDVVAVETVEGPTTVDGFVDYNQIYEELQQRFNQSYAISQKLFIAEKTQRQTLYHYKRRLNALLDVLQDIEGDSTDIDEPLAIDTTRLSSIVAWRPELAQDLNPVLQMASDDLPSQIPLKRSYGVNLAVDEMIPEIPNDELDSIELNPHDTDMWTRRNFMHLVVSKFRPAEIRARGIKEYVDSSSLGSKRKRRS